MKCKKLVSMFLVVFMLVSIALIQTINVSADSSGTIYVSSYPDLVNMMKNPGGSYILLKDIEINNADNFSVQNFSGIFDGNGHSISFSNSRAGEMCIRDRLRILNLTLQEENMEYQHQVI